MRLRVAGGLVLALLATGCGGARHAATVGTTVTARTVATAQSRLEVGVVGALSVDVPGTAVRRGSLAAVADAPFVLVAAGAAPLAAVSAAARAHPASHFALVGASTGGGRARNLVGLVANEEQAALLAGLVAGYEAAGQGGESERVAWVGPEADRLVQAFARGVHKALPHAVVLNQPSRSVPAECKEAALAAIGRGAAVIVAHGGLCADAALAGAHNQDLPGLSLGEFEFPNVVANAAVREAVAGIFRGNEDLVFGMASGAVGVGTLDPRISSGVLLLARAAAQGLARTPLPAR
jgi:basic membrane lipoprotein Med (substrate-binding protein (PBP1-ABC) superfamily)